MSTMTFRARDNATALELVERRFGGDALILSTVYVDGRVEITATDEVPPPASSEAAAFGTSRRRIDVVLDEDVTLEPQAAPAPAPEAAPEPTNETTLPGVLRRAERRPFAEALEEAKQATPVSSKPATPTSSASASQRRADILAARRIVLVGPSGAGKTQVALQLALLCRARSPKARTGFVFCGTGSKADGAVLAQKSHLLGMTTVFKKPADLDAPALGETEIVLLSGRVQDAVLQARGLLGAPGTQTLLVLPDGLRPQRIARLGDQWREITSSVTFGHVAEADVAEAETALPDQSGLELLWLSDPDALVDGLRPVGPDGITPPDMPPTGDETTSAPDLPAGPVVFRSHHKTLEARP